MKYLISIFLILLCPLFIMSQEVILEHLEVEGILRAETYFNLKDINQDESSTQDLTAGTNQARKYDHIDASGKNRSADYIVFGEIEEGNPNNRSIGTANPTAFLDINEDERVKGKIRGLSNPISAQDAATKAYIDVLETQVSVMNTILLDAGNNGTVSDAEGNVYKTIKIGNQIWMAENLNIGKMIAGSDNQTNNGTIEKYCYNDSKANCDIYGGLYQWNEMMQYNTVESIQGICPTGWHLPSDDEIKTLEMTLGMTQVEADMSGSRGTDQGSQLGGNSHLWTGGPLVQNAAFGRSGFASLPGGIRTINKSFDNQSDGAYFWSSTQSGTNAWGRGLYYLTPKVDRENELFNTSVKDWGLSVRCVQD